ncbi:MAG: AAA family ATPase [Bernardetiaceae bacterium]|nr:AAA family ATPase [Bernardetiaceae bacterium]
MKILRLCFKNIHSLQGTHTVDFTASPLSDTGLFAITGDTGAGKTTILDAILLALYGRTPRHEKTRLIEEFKEGVMTRGEEECFAELEFETPTGNFRARWETSKARTGTMKKDEMFLYELPSGKALDLHKKADVQQKIIDLVGLDYERFLRSVMLAQGKFAEFLQAGDTERAEILEKITGTGIYAELSKAAYDKSKEEETKLKALESEIEATNLLTPEAIATYQSELEQIQNREHKVDTAIKQYQNFEKWHEEIAQLRHEATQILSEAERVTQKESEFEKQKTRLALHEKAIAFKPEIQQLERSQKEAKTLLLDLENLKIEEQKQQQIKAQAQEIAQKSAQEFQRREGELEHTEKLVREEVLPLDTKIVEASKQLKIEQEKLQQEEMQFLSLQDSLKKGNMMLKDKAKDLKEAEAFCQKYAHYETLNVEYLDAMFKDNEQRRDKYTKLHKEQKNIEARKTALRSELQTLESECNTLKQELEKQKAQREEAQAKIEALLKGETPEYYQNLYEEHSLKSEQWQTLQQIALAFKDKNESYKTLETNLNEKQKQWETLHKNCQDLRKTYSEANEKKTLLQKSYEKSLLIVKYESDRAKLVEGEPCPLCGATEHPLANNDLEIEIDKEEKQLEQQRNLVLDLQNELQNLESERITTEADLQHWSREKQEMIDTLEALKTDFNKAKTDYQISEGDITEAKSITATWKESQQHKEYAQNLNRKINHLLPLSQVSADMEARLERFNRKNQDYELKTKELAHFNVAYDKLTTDLAERATEGKAAAQQFLQQLERYQVPNLEGIRKWKQEDWDKVKMRLLEKQNNLKDQKTAKENLALEKERIDTKLKAYHTQYAEKEKTLGKLQADYNHAEVHLQQLNEKRHALFGKKLPTEEIQNLKNKLHQSKEKYEQALLQTQQADKALDQNHTRSQTLKEQFSKQENEIVTLDKQLLERALKAGFESVDRLKQSILDEQSYIQIQREAQALEQQKNRAATLLKQNAEKLEQARNRKLTEYSLAEVRTQLEDFQQQKENMQSQKHEWRIALENHRKAEERNESIKQRIEAQQALSERWRKLNDLIGSADGGKKFRPFAQSLTLAKLVAAANRHLLTLNERYRIERRTDDNRSELDLQIVDTYQANSKRSMNTLSGGETFLVSLALALGLSEIAGRNSRIGSLFIDEGFGTLDPDTLQAAIDTLENLQTDGRTIGIISHVDALKERIATQIRVRKQSNGLSKLEIVG